MCFKRILAAIDASPLSQLVFDQALEIAERDGATLKLFHCMSSDVIAGMPHFSSELGLSPQFLTVSQHNQYHLEQQSREIRDLLRRYCEMARSRNVPVEFEYRMMDAGQGLCQTAQTWQADLVVIGRRGRRGIAEALLGSVSNYVLHHAPCAVLVIQAANQTAAAASSSV
jgi:nucleotide-binding universal stress UspA family protein